MKTKLHIGTVMLIVVGLVMTTTALSISVEPEDNIQAQTLFAQKQTQTLEKKSLQKPITFDGTQLTISEFDETHPSIAASPAQAFMAAFDGTEDGIAYFPYFLVSPDGINWDGGYFPSAEGASYPEVDYKSLGFYGTNSPSPLENSLVWLIDYSTGELLGATWDFTSANIFDLTSMRISCYTHEGPAGDPGLWNWGILAFTGYNGYNGANIDGCPFIFYQGDEAGQGWIGWLTGTANNCEHATVDIDLVTNMSYSVYDRFDGAKYELLVRKDDFGAWDAQNRHSYVTSKHITDTGSLTYPDVVADNNNVFVVAQLNNSGNQDVVCFISTNGMATNTKTVIADSTSDEMYPRITMVKEGIIVCSYVKDGAHYYRMSEDNGATWGDELRVSDEQLDPVEYCGTDIYGINGKGYTVWSDGRNGNSDIYIDQFVNIASPIIQVGAVTGGIGKVSMVVTNVGDGEATNVPWGITVTGGILGRINVSTTGTIATLAPGASTTVTTSGFILGLGAISVVGTADTASVTKTGTQLLFFTKIK